MTKWESIYDNPPEDYVDVLVKFTDGKMAVCYKCGPHWFARNFDPERIMACYNSPELWVSLDNL